jgi:hypothetical protein
MLLLSATFAANRHRTPPRPPLPLPPAITASTATTVVKLAIVHCQRKRQQQHHHQRNNGSTNVKMFTSPDDLDLFNLSTVSREFSNYQVVSLNNFGPFLQSTYS